MKRDTALPLLDRRILILFIINMFFKLIINVINFGKSGLFLTVTNVNENIVLLSSFFKCKLILVGPVAQSV